MDDELLRLGAELALLTTLLETILAEDAFRAQHPFWAITSKKQQTAYVLATTKMPVLTDDELVDFRDRLRASTDRFFDGVEQRVRTARAR